MTQTVDQCKKGADMKHLSISQRFFSAKIFQRFDLAIVCCVALCMLLLQHVNAGFLINPKYFLVLGFGVFYFIASSLNVERNRLSRWYLYGVILPLFCGLLWFLFI